MQVMMLIYHKCWIIFTVAALTYSARGYANNTSIYWHSCGWKAEQLDKRRKGLKTCKQHNKPTKWREGSSPLAVTGWNLVMIWGIINKGAVLFGARDKTWKPCGRSEPRQDRQHYVEGGINYRGKRMGEWYLERMTLKEGTIQLFAAAKCHMTPSWLKHFMKQIKRFKSLLQWRGSEALTCGDEEVNAAIVYLFA